MNILKKGLLVLLGLALGVAAQAATEPTVNYVYNDHLGTPRVVVNSANKVIWQNEGEPFGNVAPQEDPDGDGVKYTLNLRFPGQYYDSESGRNQNYYRDYNPATGRYIQSDPIGLGGGINTFGYVGGDPLSDVDPEGLSGKIPKNYGKRKPFNPPPDLTKEAKEKNEKNEGIADTIKNLPCQLGLAACPLDPEMYICEVARCSPKCGEPFTIDYTKKDQLPVFVDTAVTKCVCMKRGFNPNYRGGPPPGL